MDQNKPNNIIDLNARRNKKGPVQAKDKGAPEAPVVSMTERRNEMIQRERRELKRTMLTEFIGACCVIPNVGLARVNLYDISENGIAFDINKEQGHFKEGEEVAMRLYISQNAYFPFNVKIAHLRMMAQDDVIRHGAEFIAASFNREALSYFVKFIETVSASIHTDGGDVMVSNGKV